MTFSVRHAQRTREPFGAYEYEILDDDGERVIARYWHDFRGDDHGIEFLDGRKDFPTGLMTEFLSGGGPQPLTLTPWATRYLRSRLAASE
jgi:hypothetical protein